MRKVYSDGRQGQETARNELVTGAGNVAWEGSAVGNGRRPPARYLGYGQLQAGQSTRGNWGKEPMIFKTEIMLPTHAWHLRFWADLL